MNKKWITISAFVFTILNCANDKREQATIYVTTNLPPCSCTAKMIRPIATRKLLDSGLEEYTQSKKILLDPTVEEEILSIPEIFLYDVSIQEKKSEEQAPLETTKHIWEASGKISQPKLEVFLKDKKVEEIEGFKIYSSKSTGQKGLELIQGFSKERRKEKKLDRDKYYKDRIDMLEKFKK